MVWRATDPEGHESDKAVKWLLVPYTRGQGLDVGCGTHKPFDHFTGVDNGHHWGRGVADIVSEATDLSIFADCSQNYVFSSHCLEHVRDYKAALQEWWRVIKPRGCLVLVLPHRDLYPNIGQPGSNPDHKHDFVPQDIIDAMTEIGQNSFGWNLLENEVRGEGNEYSFFLVFDKRHDQDCRTDTVWQRNPEGKKRCLVVRYGAIGDVMQTSSLFPLLKKQGYHVTFNCTQTGAELTTEDPNVDEWLVQDKDQVPNEDLGRYFVAFKDRYDRIVNLTESVEGNLLSMPSRTSYWWPHALRHKALNVNYLERMHDIAELPYEFSIKFYPTAKEVEATKSMRAKMGGGLIALWVMVGSSQHKTYPYGADVICWLLEKTDLRIVLMGDKRSQILDRGICWNLLKRFGHKLEDLEKLGMRQLSEMIAVHYGVNRFFPWSGQWSVRNTLAFAQQADIVIGPETGVLNAVAFEKVPKVIMLSHSSKENLTRDWKNTMTIEPVNTPCFSCHQLHYDNQPVKVCPKDEATHAAVCAASIKPERLFQAITFFLKGAKAA